MGVGASVAMPAGGCRLRGRARPGRQERDGRIVRSVLVTSVVVFVRRRAALHP